MHSKLTPILFCFFAWACSSGSVPRATSPNPNETPPSSSPTDAGETGPKSEIVSATSGTKTNDSRVTNVTLGPVGSKEDFTLEIVKKDIKGLAKETLWVDRDFNFSDRAPEEGRQNTEMVIQDIKDCGFSLFGPACIDNQKINVSTMSVVTINAQSYIFLVFYYRLLKSPYAAFLELNESDARLEVKKIFVYELKERLNSYSPHSILKETAGTSVAVFEVNSLTPERAGELAKYSGNLRKKIYLLKWLASNPGSLDPQKIMTHQARIFDDLLTKEQDVIESGETNLFYLFLKAVRQASSEIDYHSYLSSKLDDLNYESLKSEVSIELLMLGDGLSSSLLKSLNYALSFDNTGTVLRALDVVVARKDEFPLDFYAHIIPLLNAEEEEISNRADLALTGVKIPEDLFPLLGRLIKRVGRNEKTLPYALNHLISTGNPKAISMIYGELSNPKAEVRKAIFEQARSFKADDLYLPVLQEQINKSEEIYILEFILRKVGESDTPIATQFFIDNLYHKDVMVREKLFSVIKDRSLIPAHIDNLLAAYDHRREDIRLTPVILDALIRINEPRGLNPVLQFIRESQEESVRREYINRVKDCQFGPENLGEMEWGVLHHNSDDVKSFFYDLVFGMDNFGSNDILIDLIKLLTDAALKERMLETLDQRILGGNNPDSIRSSWMGPNSELRQKGLEYILRSEGPGASRVMAAFMVDQDESMRRSVINELDTREPEREMWDELIYNIMGGRDLGPLPGGRGARELSSSSSFQETIEASFRYLKPLVTGEDIPYLMSQFGKSSNPQVIDEFPKFFEALFLEHPEYSKSEAFRESIGLILDNDNFSYGSEVKLKGKAAVIKFAATLNDDAITKLLRQKLIADPDSLDPVILSALQEALGAL